MRRYFLVVLLFFSTLNAEGLIGTKEKRLILKGKRIVELLCDRSKLPKAQGEIDSLAKKVLESKACGAIGDAKSRAVAYYLLNTELAKSKKPIAVPQSAKCPVCGMFVAKYPKWVALMVIDGKKYYFDGVKDMMKYYFFDQDFPYDRSKIERVEVTDYYTLEPIDATKAFYVVGANIYGPMGNEFIPFKTQKEAENFKQEHAGRVIVKMQEITPQMVLSLDRER